MPHRTRAWIWAGRTVAAVAALGLAGYMYAVGLDQAVKLAAPIGAVIAMAALAAPYLLPAYQPPSPPPASPIGPAAPSPDGGIVIIADHRSVAAQHIHDVTMNAPRPDPSAQGGQAGP